MPELLVMRHAKSDWSTGLFDFDRPLSRRGHHDAPHMAQWLDDEDHVPDAILTSAANRARTTAQYVADHFALTKDVVEAHIDLYHAHTSTWLDVLRALRGQTPDCPDCLLICGHNPGLDDLVEFLAGETPALTADGKLLTTAAIAVFTVDDWSTLSSDTARFEQMMRPREVR